MGGKSAKKITVGYRYFWDVHAGLGRGPVNEIVAITADKKTVFAAKSGEITGNTSIYIDKPDLFGGDDTGGEGGIKGTLDIMMGERNQMPTPRLLKLLTGIVPGFRGIVTTFFSGMVSCYSASPKPWSYRVRRSTKGWDGVAWYPEKALILLRNDKAKLDDAKTLSKDVIDNIKNIHAMNPAHILLECAINRDWGRGLTLDDIDLDAFKKAADTLYREGFGLCFRYNRQDGLDTFVQQVLDHIGAAQYGDLSTGKLTLKLIRDDYNAEDLPLFTYDNGILSVQDDDSTSIDSAPNEITVTYHDPVTNSDGEARAQNLGAIQSVGLISRSIDYKALPTYDLAARVAQRDLELGTAGVSRFVINFDRRGGVLAPASVFRVSLPDHGIDNMVLRVGKIDEMESGALTITAIHDIFGMPDAAYSEGQQGSEWNEPDKTAKPVTTARVIELPYVVLASTLGAAELDYLTPESGYIGILAAAPSSYSINYQLQTCAAGKEFETRTIGDWAHHAVVISDIGALDTEIIISTDIYPVIDSGVMIDDEILAVTAINPALNTITVSRGCADTLPHAHAAGSMIWFFTENLETDNQEYVSGESVNARLLTQTSAEILDESLAQIITAKMAHRHTRPYLPGNIQINGVLYPPIVDVADSYTVSYAHRDRILQGDRLIDCRESNIGGEPSTVYRIQLISQSGQSAIDFTTNETSIELPYVTDKLSDNSLHTLLISSVRDGIESLYTFSTKMPSGRIKIVNDDEAETEKEQGTNDDEVTNEQLQ